MTYRNLHNVLLLLVAFVLAGCDHKSNVLITGYGDVDILPTFDGTVKGVAGASDLTVEFPEWETMWLSAENQEAGFHRDWATVNEFYDDLRKLPVGRYVFRAGSGDVLEEGFVEPVFGGEAAGDVRESDFTEVSLPIAPARAFLSASFDASLREAPFKMAFRAKSKTGSYVSFGEEETRTAVLMPGEVKAELLLTSADGKTLALQPLALEAQAARHYDFRFSLQGTSDEPVLQVIADEATLAEPYQLVVNDALFATESPVMSPFGFGSGRILQMVEKSVPAESVGCDIDIPGGLKHLYLTVVSPNLKDNQWSEEVDLVGKDFADAGFVMTGNQEGSHNVHVDFTGVLSRLEADGVHPTTHRFVLQATDAAGRVCNEPVQLDVEILPIVMEMAEPEPVRMQDDVVTLRLESNIAELGEGLAVQYMTESMEDWNSVAPESVEPLGGGTYAVSVNVGSGIERTALRMAYLDRYSNSVMLDRIVPEFTVTCPTETVWTSRADLYVDCEGEESILPYLKVLVRENGGSWHPAVVDRSVEERRITVKTLMASTAYTIRVMTTESHVKDFDITTEPAIELPNGDFEDNEVTIKINNLNCGGKYSNKESWMTVYNKTNIEVREPEDWVSVNAKTCSSFAKTANSWFLVPTTELLKRPYSGQFAVRLRNAAWDLNGVEPPRDARVDNEYYSSIAPHIANRSAGKLFLGKYSFDASGQEVYEEGIPFASRPTAVAGFYSYVQDIHDGQEKGLVVVRLLHESDGKTIVIGEGRGELNPSTSYTRFIVPIRYTVRNKPATRLQLMISSSNYASYNQSEESRLIKTTNNFPLGISTGAELWVDRLALLYE